MQRVSLDLIEIEESQAEPATDIQLPDVQLPLSVNIDQFSVDKLYLNGDLLLQELQLTAQAQGSQLQLNNMSLAYEDYRASLQGKLELGRDWPLNLRLEVNGTAPELGHQQVQVSVSGELQREVHLSGTLQGVLQGQLSGTAQPLLAALPASLDLTLEQLQLQQTLPEGLAVNNLHLAANGSLEKGFVWQLNSALQAQQARFELSANGQADTTTAVVEQLRLAHAEQGHVELQARAKWLDDVTAHATVKIEHFPWQLFAGLDEAPVSVDSAQIEFNYANERYQGDIQANLQGPAGSLAVQGQLQGDAEQVHVEPLLVTAGSGRVQGVVQAAWQDALSWQTKLEIQQLIPAYWVTDFSGEVSGHLHSTGRMYKQLSLNTDLQLTGELRGQPLKANVQAKGQGHRWQLPELDIRLGDNRIHGQFQLDEQLAGQLKIGVLKPGQLLTGAAGTLQGDIKMGGTLQQANLDLQLMGTNLAFDGQRLRELQLKGSLRQGQTAKLDVSANGLVSNEEQLGQLQLKADGTLEKHQLTLNLQGPVAHAGMQLSGSLQADNLHWHGQMQQLQLAVDNQKWQLEQLLNIDYLHEKHLVWKQHCLIQAWTLMCQDSNSIAALTTDYALQNLSLASFTPWLPEGLAIDGSLNGQFKLIEQPGGLQGKLLLDAGQGALLLTQESQRFAWSTLAVKADLLPKKVDAHIELQGAKQGHLLVQATIDPRPADKPISGQFHLQDLNLNVLHALVGDIDQLSGHIEGQGDIGGTLLKPRIDGEIHLSDGQIGGGLLPVSMEQLNLAIQIAGQQANISGRWRSGENGQAQLSGNASWADITQANLYLKGQDLPVFVEPYADLQITPDLHVDYSSKGLSVTGKVDVPRGKISVPELPPGSVSVSSDAVVVGRESQESDLDVHMNIAINVGSERLKFSGFGLTSDVQGNLLVGDNASGRGVLELKNGRFRGYGQKLDLRRARLVFSGPLTQPYIDIEAVRVTGDVTAGMRITGLAEQPQTQIFSEPPMAQEQAMSWLLLGKPLGGDGNLVADAALAMGLMGILPTTQKIAGSLGIEDFQLDSEGSGNQTSVVASGRITERLSLRYGVGIFEPGNTLGLRYQLTQRLYLDAASGLASSLDLFYRRSF